MIQKQRSMTLSLPILLAICSTLTLCQAFSPSRLFLSPFDNVGCSTQQNDVTPLSEIDVSQPKSRRFVMEQLVIVGFTGLAGLSSPVYAKVKSPLVIPQVNVSIPPPLTSHEPTITPTAQDTPPPKKALGEEYRQGTAALSDSDETAVVPKEAYKKLPSGVVYADLRDGGGDVADVGKKCNIQWVLRKSNGYFVDSSEVAGGVPFIFTVGDAKGGIQGIDEGVRGMKVGGVRRILIPPSLAWVEGLEDGKPGPLPVGFGPRQQMKRVMLRRDVPGEYVFMEVQLTRVR